MIEEDFTVVSQNMLLELAQADQIFSPSEFWKHYAAKNLSQISTFGIENFKRTVNQNYFNWLSAPLTNGQFQRLLKWWAAHPTTAPLEVELRRPDFLEGFFSTNPFDDQTYCDVYRIFVGLLWQVAIANDPSRLNELLSEPQLGSPIETRWQGKAISQDLANSLRERNAITSLMGANASDHPVIGELGGGYGRLGHVFLSGSECRYLMFDIPPALAVAQWYLPKVLPEKRVFRFRHIDSFSQIENELTNADVAFFTPNQLALLPDDYIDTFVSISSLGEMSLAQIDNFKRLIGRVTRGLVYFKQWRQSENAFDNIIIKKEDYELSEPWHLVMDRTDDIQESFQEMAFVKQPTTKTTTTTSPVSFSSLVGITNCHIPATGMAISDIEQVIRNFFGFYLQREADSPSVAHLRELIREGWSLDSLAKTITQSNEFLVHGAWERVARLAYFADGNMGIQLGRSQIGFDRLRATGGMPCQEMACKSCGRSQKIPALSSKRGVAAIQSRGWSKDAEGADLCAVCSIVPGDPSSPARLRVPLTALLFGNTRSYDLTTSEAERLLKAMSDRLLEAKEITTRLGKQLVATMAAGVPLCETLNLLLHNDEISRLKYAMNDFTATSDRPSEGDD